MQTYGKATCGLSAAAWPPDADNRRHLFDSSAGANSSNPSVCVEPTETSNRKKSTVGLRRVRTTKKKSVVSLKENCEPSKEPARRGNLVSRQVRLLRRKVQPAGLYAEITVESAGETSSSNSAMSEVEPKQTRKRKKSTSVGSRRATKRQATEKGPSDSSIPKSMALPPRPAQLVTQRVCPQSSISEAEDQTFSPYHRKPLFCSTPSLQLAGKRPGESAAPVSTLDLSAPEELVPSGDAFSPPLSAPLGEPGSGCKMLPIITEAPDMHETPSVILISDSSDSAYRSCETSGDGKSSLSVSRESEILIHALKDMCLSKRCQVQLGRVDLPQTPYFSCLGYSSSALVESGQTAKLSERLCPGPPCHVTDYSASLIDGQSVYPSELITDTFNLFLSVDTSQSVAQCDSSDNKSSVTDVHNSSLAHQQQVSKQVPEDKAAMIVAKRKEKCLAKKSTVPLKRLALTRSTGAHGRGMHSEQTASENGSTRSEDMTTDAKECVRNPNERRPKKFSRAAKDTKRRSVSRDRTGATRKAFVSGQSVSRWRDKGNASAAGFQNRHALKEGSKAGDCSITELLSGHHNEPKAVNGGLLHGSGMVFSTPVRAVASHLDLSSLLANLTPETHTWSRLKAQLSVHRRVTVMITPRKLQTTSVLESPGRAGLVDGNMDLYDVPVISTPFSRRLQSRLQNSSAFLNISEGAELSDAEKVYAECNQQGALCWEECILPARLKRCKKIGEGTFGEVFSTVDASGDTVALKIIPIEGKEKVNGEEQKTFGDILHEMIISKELSSLKEKQHNQTFGFIGLHGLHCVKGSYPAVLLKAWNAFDRQKGSGNDRPDFFDDEQLFLILEFEFGGSDLENSNGTLSSLVVAKSILHQVTAALAVAEQQLRFEHRDLHWGNILVKTTKEKSAGFFLNGTEHSLDTEGVLVRIIDYSLSRLEIDGLTVACDISEDDELFMGRGDYQYDIYRLMREHNGNKWDDYQPHSNVMWLHYLCAKLLSMKYRVQGLRAKKPREELNHIHDSLLHYRSATEALQSGLF